MKKITDKQKKILDRKGISYDPGMSARDARALVKKAFEMASHAQLDALDKLGARYEWDITEQAADELIKKAYSANESLKHDIEDEYGLLLDLMLEAGATFKYTTDARKKSYQGTVYLDCPISGCSGCAYVSVKGNYGGCFECSWQNLHGAGPIGFYMTVENASFIEALAALGVKINSNLESPNADAIKEVTSTPTAPKKTLLEFRADWHQWVEWGKEAYFWDEHYTARAYLEGRGIDPATVQAFGVGVDPRGYNPHKESHCLLFPYYDQLGLLVAVNRRIAKFVKDDKSRLALGSRKKAGIFSTLEDPQKAELTWVIEGEINALSVWQVLQLAGFPDRVLSLSDEGMTKTRALEMQNRYGSVIVWCDKPKIQDYIRDDGVMAWATKRDANDLLMAGELWQAIDWIRCRGTDVRELGIKQRTIEELIEDKEFELALKTAYRKNADRRTIRHIVHCRKQHEFETRQMAMEV